MPIDEESQLSGMEASDEGLVRGCDYRPGCSQAGSLYMPVNILTTHKLLSISYSLSLIISTPLTGTASLSSLHIESIAHIIRLKTLGQQDESRSGY